MRIENFEDLFKQETEVVKISLTINKEQGGQETIKSNFKGKCHEIIYGIYILIKDFSNSTGIPKHEIMEMITSVLSFESKDNGWRKRIHSKV